MVVEANPGAGRSLAARALLRSIVPPAACLIVAAGTWMACAEKEISGDPEPSEFPPTARMHTVQDLRADLAAPRHASDGGGRAWLEDGPTEVVISTRHRWTIVYEAGPLGVAQGGTVFFLTSPFWGWDDWPQPDYPDAPGYTEVSTEAEGVELEARALDRNMLGVEIGGRALREGERIRFVYGAGEIGALADKFGERGSTFWVAVDGDGDGVRKVLDECPSVDVLPGPPAGLWMTVPSVVGVGEEARVAVALLDRRGNAWVDWSGDVVFTDVPEGLVLPERVTLGPRERSATVALARVEAAGLYHLEARLDPPLPGTPDDFAYESNPMLASSETPLRVLWADLHGHSQLSDGTGTPEDFYRYARDVAALDVAALTDHDHWGVRFLDQSPEIWAEIGRVTAEFHEPGRFVTLLGYEWTSWIYGHRHVLYFEDEGELHSSVDPAKETPAQLWDALRGQSALTFAHHSAGGPIATDWSFAPDPVLEPVTEVVSVHGSSEAMDSPGLIHSPLDGNFVRDVLDRGFRFGFIGSGDSHDGHPGLTHLAGQSGGLAAILADEPTRESVLAALRARRVFATNGERILLRASLGGHRMGATLPAAEAGKLELRVHVIGTAPIELVEIVKTGDIVAIDCAGEREVALPPLAMELASGEYLYVRVRQTTGGLAWSSPFYVE